MALSLDLNMSKYCVRKVNIYKETLFITQHTPCRVFFSSYNIEKFPYTPAPKPTPAKSVGQMILPGVFIYSNSPMLVGL